MKSLEKVRMAREFLESCGIEDAEREAELIVSHCLGTERLTIYKDNPQVPDAVIQEIDRFLRRRAGREPLQYIFGYAEFHGIRIRVGQGVLIPRPETELLAEEAVKAVKRNVSGVGDLSLHISRSSSLRVLDLCTGSGCVALALANEFRDADVYGTDASAEAISYARENARINDIGNVTFLRGSLFEPVRGIFTDGNSSAFDLITANPPYIRHDDIKDLQPEIREWEPAEALDGGKDGLDYYRMIIPASGNHLRKRGSILLEIGIGQAEDVKKMAEEAGFSDISVIRDYAGIERIVVLKRG
jgi:release factor glutamine methyltransferase